MDRTLVNHHATGNEVPPPWYRGYVGLPVRRLAGVLAGRLEPTPALLPRHVSSGRTLGQTKCGSAGTKSSSGANSTVNPSGSKNSRMTGTGSGSQTTTLLALREVSTMTSHPLGSNPIAPNATMDMYLLDVPAQMRIAAVYARPVRFGSAENPKIYFVVRICAGEGVRVWTMSR